MVCTIQFSLLIVYRTYTSSPKIFLAPTPIPFKTEGFCLAHQHHREHNPYQSKTYKDLCSVVQLAC